MMIMLMIMMMMMVMMMMMMIMINCENMYYVDHISWQIKNILPPKIQIFSIWLIYFLKAIKIEFSKKFFQTQSAFNC